MIGKILVLNLEVMKQAMNMNDWIDLEMRLLKNKTIDKNIQEQINREKDRWKKSIVENYCCSKESW